MSHNFIRSLLVDQQNDMPLNARLNQRLHSNLQYSNIDELLVTSLPGQLMESTFVQTQQSIPTNTHYFYFEVIIQRKAVNRSLLSVGIADAYFPMNKQLGHTSTSYGYWSDGKIFYTRKEHGQISQPFKQEDVIGCGVDLLRKKVFYTHNGHRQTPTLDLLKDVIFFPTVSMVGDIQFQFNFGKLPFKFKFEKLLENEKNILVEDILIQQVSPYSLHLMIQEYLWSSAYFDTLYQFENESSLEPQKVQMRQGFQQERQDISLGNHEICQVQQEDHLNNIDIEQNESKKKIKLDCSPLQRKMSGLQSPNFLQLLVDKNSLPIHSFNLDYPENNVQDNSDLLNKERQKIRELLSQGCVSDVIQLLLKMAPDLMTNQTLNATLHSQQFLELRKNIHKLVKSSDGNSIQYAQKYLSNSLDIQIASVKETSVQQVLSLICFNNPSECKYSYLLGDAQRACVAEYVNKQILSKTVFNKHIYNQRKKQPSKFVQNK